MGRSHRARDGPRDGGVWGGGGRSSGYNEHRSVSPSRPGGGYYAAPSGGPPPHHRDVTPEGGRRGSGAYTSTPPLMPMPLPGGGVSGGGGGGRSRGGFGGGDVTDQLHQLRERELQLQSQLESKNILLDERQDEIASLKEYCDTLSRTLRSKDDESELLQQAMERINAAHSQTVGGRAPHELAEEVQRLESMLRTSHNQGKNLYGDYKKLLQDYDEVEAQLQEARVRVDMLQQEKQDLLGLHCNPHHSHQHQHQQQNLQQQQQPLAHRGGITTPASGVEPPPPPPPQQQQQQPQHPPSAADEQAVGPGALLTFSPPGAKKTSAPPPLAGREARERKKQQQARERADKEEKARAAAAAEDEAARQLRESHGRAMQEVAAVTDRLRAAKRENEALQRRLDESEAQRQQQQAPAARSASSATAATTGTLTTLSATDAAGGAAVNLEGVLRMERENQLLTEEIVALRRRLRDAPSVSPVPSAPAATPAVPAALVARLAELEAAAEAAAKERDHLRAAAASGGEVSALLARVVGLEAKLAEVQGENVALRQQQQQQQLQQPSAEDSRRAQALHGRIRQLEEHLTMVAAEARGLREHEAASGPLMDRIAGLEGLLEDTEEGLMENYRAVLAENEALRAAAAAAGEKDGDSAGLLAGYEALVRENQALKREASARSASGSGGGGGGEVNGALLERNRQLVEENAALRTDVAALKDVQESVVKADTEAAVAAQDRKALLDEVLRLRELLNQTESPEDIALLRRQLQSRQDEIRSLEDSINALKADMAEANKPDRHVRDMQVLYGKVQEFKDTEDTLARALGENELLRGYTRDAATDLHARLGALHAESFELKKQLQRTDDAAPVLIEEDKQMFSNEIRKISDQTSELRDSLSNLRAQMASPHNNPTPDDVVRTLRDAGAATAVLQEEVNFLRGVLTDHEGASSSLVQRMKAQITDLQREVASRRDDTSERRLRTEAEELSNEVARLTRALAEGDETMRRRLQELTLRNEEVEEDNAYLKERLEPFPDAVGTLRQQTEAQQGEIAELAAENGRLEAECRRLRGANEQLQASAQDGRSAAASFHTQLSRRAAELLLGKTRLGSLAVAYRRLRDHAARARRMRSVAATLARGTARGLAHRHYHALRQHAYAGRAAAAAVAPRPSRAHLSHALLRLTQKEALRWAYDRLRTHAVWRRREADNHHWLNVLWQTKGQASEAARRRHNELLVRRYYEKLRRFGTRGARARRFRAVLEALLASTARGTLAAAFRRWTAFRAWVSEARRRERVQDSVLLAFARVNVAAHARMRLARWRRYAEERSRERERERTRLLNLNAAELLLSTTATSSLRAHYVRWTKVVSTKEKGRKCHSHAADILLNATNRGKMLRAYKRLAEYARARAEAARLQRRRQTILAGLSRHSAQLSRRRAWETWAAYVTGKREEGFYWRQKHAIEKVGGCLSSLTKRGVLAKYYAKLRDYAVEGARERLVESRRRAASHVLLSHTKKGLLRVYFGKLQRFMKAMQRLDAKYACASALLSSTQRAMAYRGFVALLAWAARGGRRHVRMVSNAGVFPLRIVTGGATECCTVHEKPHSARRGLSPRREQRERERGDGGFLRR